MQQITGAEFKQAFARGEVVADVVNHITGDDAFFTVEDKGKGKEGKGKKGKGEERPISALHARAHHERQQPQPPAA